MPIAAELLKLIIADQRETEQLPSEYYHRDVEAKLNELTTNKEIIVMTGIRRSGKSVLLQQIRHQAKEQDYYFNFEDERLATFAVEDFQKLYEVFIELFGVQKTFYFDEIQNIPGWEQFVRRLYNANNKIYLTGSNATLFSEELGTRLTGRYIPVRVYPFSFHEFSYYKEPEIFEKKNYSTIQVGEIKKLFSEYCRLGGIPEYVKVQQQDYLPALYESIIYRDILARYKLLSDKTLKKLVFYLASHCSKDMSYSSLKKLLGLGSVTTVSDYCGYLENSFLCFFVNRYSESLKAQEQSPKKVYFIDHVLARVVGFRFSEDIGRMLENIVFIELKRRNFDIYYHSENKGCDFILKKMEKIVGAIQVCQNMMDHDTKNREVSGLLEALERYGLKKGTILTESEEGTFSEDYNQKKYEIQVMPVWKFLLSDFQKQ